jgi:hypothetical protein
LSFIQGTERKFNDQVYSLNKGRDNGDKTRLMQNKLKLKSKVKVQAAL